MLLDNHMHEIMNTDIDKFCQILALPNDARQSAATVLTLKLHIFSTNFLWLSMITNNFYSLDNTIQNGWWDLDNCGTLSVNSFVPGRSWCDFKNVIFNLGLLIGILKSSDIVLRCMPHDLTDDKSTLVQVMAWCRQATSHNLNQCWPRSPRPYGVTRPQWVKDSLYAAMAHSLLNLSIPVPVPHYQWDQMVWHH